MADGDEMLDADGNEILDADGNEQLSDGAGDGCCCCGTCAAEDLTTVEAGCIRCKADGLVTPTPRRVTVSFSSGVTVCTGCTPDLSGFLEALDYDVAGALASASFVLTRFTEYNGGNYPPDNAYDGVGGPYDSTFGLCAWVYDSTVEGDAPAVTVTMRDADGACGGTLYSSTTAFRVIARRLLTGPGHISTDHWEVMVQVVNFVPARPGLYGDHYEIVTLAVFSTYPGAYVTCCESETIANGDSACAIPSGTGSTSEGIVSRGVVYDGTATVTPCP